MRWVDDLKEEHREVGRMLKAMLAMAAWLESGGKVTDGELAGTLQFLTVFVDQCHHGKEEKFLIPALAATGVPVDSGVVALVFEEHVEGRHHVSEMRKHAAGIAMGDAGISIGDQGAATSGLVDEVRAYSSLLERHITREEGELFPLAEERLDEATQLALADSFEELESDIIGPRTHEAFLEMIEQLEVGYPGH
jgi:hemerythrin-like domain-containing protein